jgi:hypothetical protein
MRSDDGGSSTQVRSRDGAIALPANLCRWHFHRHRAPARDHRSAASPERGSPVRRQPQRLRAHDLRAHRPALSSCLSDCMADRPPGCLALSRLYARRGAAPKAAPCARFHAEKSANWALADPQPEYASSDPEGDALEAARLCRLSHTWSVTAAALTARARHPPTGLRLLAVGAGGFGRSYGSCGTHEAEHRHPCKTSSVTSSSGPAMRR